MANSTAFDIADPQFEARVRESFGKQGAMALIGAELVSVEAGKVHIRFKPTAALSQQHGFVHAGIVSTALDSACGYAASTLMDAQAGVLTIEFKVNLMAPARGEQIDCIGRVKKAGRTISFTEGEAFATNNGVQKLIATMTASLMTIQGRANIKA